MNRSSYSNQNHLGKKHSLTDCFQSNSLFNESAQKQLKKSVGAKTNWLALGPRLIDKRFAITFALRHLF